MFDVCLLGTGGMMPLPHRFLTSLYVRFEGSGLLIDCGEGTQVAAKKAGVSFKGIDTICFTHFHADHISGLPGFLLTMGNAERTEPLHVIGPKGLERVVNALRTIAPELPFPLTFTELSEAAEQRQCGPFRIDACRLNHRVACYGYSVSIPRAGKFDVAVARALGLPVQTWGLLQRGETVEFDGQTYVPSMVMGPERRGLKVAYCTDTRPVPAIAKLAEGADLFICEGMYGEADKLDKAREYKHMTMREAAELARAAQPRELWLTHYSPSMMHPEEYLPELKEIFPETLTVRDGRKKTLRYEEEETNV